MRKFRWFPSAAECSIPFWVIFPFRRFFIMNAWQHHPNMAFLDSASSLCCHESVSVRWLNLSWSWPHFAVQSGRATTSLYPQLHIALKQVTGPSEEEGPMLHDSTSCQRTIKKLFGTTLNPPKYAFGISFGSKCLGDPSTRWITWSCSAAKSRDCICHSSRHLKTNIRNAVCSVLCVEAKGDIS